MTHFLSSNSLFLLSLSSLAFSFSNLAPFVSCFTPLFLSNDEAPKAKTFTSGIIMIVGSHGLITVLHYGNETLTKHFCVGLFTLGFAVALEVFFC